MSKDARAKAAEPSAAVQAKIRELAGLIRRERSAGGGVPADVTFSQIEAWGHQAGQLVAAAVDQQLVDQHRDQLAAEQPCPQCGRLCSCAARSRELVTRDGPVEFTEAACYCRRCRRSFFPQRTSLRLDGRVYSPHVLEQIVTTGGIVNSCETAARLLGALAEVQISVRHVSALTRQIGQELAAAEAARTEAYRQQSLPRVATQPETPIELACVACDGGRMQTRRAHCGVGVHDAHWRETKNAGFFRMKTQSHDADPHPRLPRCFASRAHLSGLLSGLETTAEASPPLRIRLGISSNSGPSGSGKERSRKSFTN